MVQGICKQNVTIELKEELFAESDISYSIQIWCKVRGMGFRHSGVDEYWGW